MPGLFRELARRGFNERLSGLLAARDRLPKAGSIGALDQQHTQVLRVNERERGDRQLERQDSRRSLV
jgi:hypothetical protein